MNAFNYELLQGLPPNDMNLAKIILFTINQNLRIYDYLEVEDGRVVMCNDLKQDVNRIVRQLIDNNVIVADYEGEIRLSPMMPLFATDGVNNNLDVQNSIQQYLHY